MWLIHCFYSFGSHLNTVVTLCLVNSFSTKFSTADNHQLMLLPLVFFNSKWLLVWQKHRRCVPEKQSISILQINVKAGWMPEYEAPWNGRDIWFLFYIYFKRVVACFSLEFWKRWLTAIKMIHCWGIKWR